MTQEPPSLGSSDSHAPTDDDAGSLGALSRVMCGLVALIAGAAGGIGSFIPDTNTGGVPVLLAIAALFGYLAISGQRIMRLKLGDNEARLSRAVRAARRALDDPAVPEQTKAEIAEDLDASGISLPSETRRAVQEVLTDREISADYERTLKTTLEALFPDEFDAEVSNLRGRFDALLRSNEKALVIEAKYLTVNRRVLLEQAANRLADFVALPSITAGLLVTNQSVDSLDKYPTRNPSHRIEAVTWRGPHDNEALRQSVERLLAN